MSSPELPDTQSPDLCSQEKQTAKVTCGGLVSHSTYLHSIKGKTGKNLLWGHEGVHIHCGLNWDKLMEVVIFAGSVIPSDHFFTFLDKPEIYVGRSPDCDIVLTNANFSRTRIYSISKQHFKISCDFNKSSAELTDLSKNGTFVNFSVVGKNKGVPLRHDDIISIGLSDFRAYTYKDTDNMKEISLPLELQERYKFQRILGHGSCGKVVLVQELSSKKDYAIKKINKGEINEKDHLNNPIRIKNEVEIMMKISHPCLISAKEIVENDTAVFIVLEYMRGGELASLVSSSPTPLREDLVKVLFLQMVMGVRYLHLCNITHRDLKPENILLQSKDPITTVKIADFGLSKIIETGTCLDTWCGTPCYVAPEVIDIRGHPYTEQVDVWSLGVILFYMLSKELPFKPHSNKLDDIRRLILLGKYNMTSGVWVSVSIGAKNLISKMLVKNPDERYTIHEVANHPWLAADLNVQRTVKQLLTRNSNESEMMVPGRSCDELPPRKKLKMD